MIIETRNLTELSFEKIDELMKLFEDMIALENKYNLTVKHKSLESNLSWPDMEKIKLHALLTCLEIMERHIKDKDLPIKLDVVIVE